MKPYNEQLKLDYAQFLEDMKIADAIINRDWILFEFFLSQHTTYLSELRNKLKEIIEIEKEQEDFHAKHNQIYWAKTKQKLLVLLTLLDNEK